MGGQIVPRSLQLDKEYPLVQDKKNVPRDPEEQIEECGYLNVLKHKSGLE